MQPTLALSYSSQAPTYGGIAAGWSLSVPIITEDRSQRLRTRSGYLSSQQVGMGIDPKLDDQFVSSMAGGHKLVLVDEPTGAEPEVYKAYRAQNDSTYTRYERMINGWSFRWRARTTDGNVLRFGEASLTSGCYISDQYAPLTSTIDPYGNEVRYLYQQVIPGECRLAAIVWGRNVGAGLDDFASVYFNYGDGSPPMCEGMYVNSQTDYRSGVRIVTGASRIAKITINAFPPGGAAVHTREITLGYDSTAQSCSQPHAPVRLLTSIQESAWGVDSPRVNLPAVTFEYNSPRVTLMTPQGSGTPAPWPWGDGTVGTGTLAWGYHRGDWPTVEGMFLDVDGDGIQDWVKNLHDPNSSTGECAAEWYRGRVDSSGEIHYSSPTNWQISLPRLKWRGSASPHPAEGALQSDPTSPNYEGCSLNGQATAFENAYENGSTCHHEPSTSCAPGANPNDPGTYCYPGGTTCPLDPGAAPQGERMRTYLAYRWLDMDSDGLVDLVAAVHGDIDSYDIERGNDPGNPNLNPPVPDYSLGEDSIWGIPGLGEWPSCTGNGGDGDVCADVEGCFDTLGVRTCDRFGCTINWDDVATCVNTSPQHGCADYLAKEVVHPDGAPELPVKRWPYQRCEGHNPWFIYKNLGGGRFATTPDIKYQPIPLESISGDSGLGTANAALTSENHATIDFDGDGWLDAVVRMTKTDENGDWTGPYAWEVWLGDGTGGFGPQMYVFPTRLTAPCPTTTDGCDRYGGNAISATWGSWGQDSVSYAGLLDVNGDGALDHWLGFSQSHNANVAFNEGDQLWLVNAIPTGDITTPIGSIGDWIKPGNDTFVKPTQPPPPINPFTPITAGSTSAATRTVDVDGDGRVDVVTFASDTATPLVHFNVGGQFIGTGIAYGTGAPAGADFEGLRRRTEAVAQSNGRWHLMSDLVDLDGDGIAEGVSFANGYHRAMPQFSQPPRLLRAVHNGRGAHTSITYSQMHDTNVVTQNPDQFWPDNGKPKASPRAQWVVKSLEVTDDVASTDATTSYHYTNPRFGADDDGHYGFRGFEEVTTTKPGPTGAADGSRVVERYGFDVDWSGRLVATLVMPAATGTEVHTIDTTSWQSFTLFNGAIETFHPAVMEHFICSSGQSEADCAGIPPGTGTPAGHTLTTKSYTKYPQTVGDEQLWVESASTLEAPDDPNAEQRVTSTGYELATGSNVYRLRATDTEQTHDVNGTMVTYARSRQTWDPSNGALVTEEGWVDSDDNNRAITRYVTDPDTGNRLYTWKPEQWAANEDTITNLVRTSYTYDSRKLFVASETNERGHVRNYTWEYGTGTKLETTGPNVNEDHRIRVDGLGRMIERFEATGLPWDPVTTYKVETNTYSDGPFSSVVHQKAIDQTGGIVRYAQDETDLDGHGRPIRMTVYTSGPAYQVTTFHYSPDGTLAQVDIPDPTANDASTVSYTYTYDSLGRPLSIRRPDKTNVADRSGVDLTYDGLTQTTSEVVVAGDGQPAVTKAIKDSFGRLVEVDEQLTDTPTITWATTSYEYDANDNVDEITDPKGVVTLLQHDFASQRTAITRAGRTWSYGYDKNGNLVSETAPCSPIECGWYVTSIHYDELDRPSSKDIARRDLSVPDQALFGSGQETFGYDDGDTGKGHLYHWASYAPGASSPTNESWYAWDRQGNQITAYQNFAGAGLPYSLSRELDHRYHISNEIQRVYYQDAMGGLGGVADYAYDERGLPKQVNILQLYPSTNSYVINTRNVAGLVTKRYSAAGTGPFTYVESNWTYDKLGRVESQTINKSGQQVAQQMLDYNGNDDPKTLEHTLGSSNVKQFTFEYDKRHQLTGVDENAFPHAFTAAYLYNEAGRFTSATESAASLLGGDVKPRDVDYQYAGIDPEQITSLVDAGGTYASYTYDLAGNLKTRSYPGTGESWDFDYDGKNQLRRATRKVNGVVTGSEEYWYNENGARQIVVKRDASGAKTDMIWFFGDVEAHYNGTTETKIYSHVSMGTPVGRIEHTPGGVSSLEYQFHGLASNTLATVDNATGRINASFVYAPFGEIIEATDGGAISNAGIEAHPRRMNDKYVDEGTELAYYGFRYYDKLSMTWTQSDPLYRFAPDSAWIAPRRASLYTAHLSNPLAYVDPDGRMPDAQDVEKAIELGVHVAGQVVSAVKRVAEGSGPTVAVASTAATVGTGAVAGAEAVGGAITLATVAASATVVGTVAVAVWYTVWGPGAGSGGTGEPDTGSGCGSYCDMDLGKAGRGGKSDGIPTPIDPEGDITTEVPPLPPPPAPKIPDAKIPKPGEYRRKSPQRQLPPGTSGGAGGTGGTSSSSGHKPADADGDGKVTDDEESAWMKSIQ